MKLITEMNDDVRLLIEANSEGKKNYFIENFSSFENLLNELSK